MDTKVLIIGGGLSGLHCAYRLSKLKVDFLLMEGRGRLGGRILSYDHEGNPAGRHSGGYDMGPTWFWPGQTRMENLVRELDLVDKVFLQFGAGDSLYEDGNSIQRGIPGFSMAGSYRVSGGLQQIVLALQDNLPAETVYRDAQATRLNLESGSVVAECRRNGELMEIRSELTVLALPPRLAMQSIEFAPALAADRVAEFRAIPTCMAGHAKLLAIYDQPFWRERGFSGDVISQTGPLREIHDASPEVGGPYALFGFFGVSAKQRQQRGSEMIPAAIDQLTRLFGNEAQSPASVFIKDWAEDRHTATDGDREMLNFHPAPALRRSAEPEWDRRVLWAGSEASNSAERVNGFLEGAIESSERVIAAIESHLMPETTGYAGVNNQGIAE
ncbi:MAG: hypothetical protein [Olavius algarvensis Gamma 3 endosymbiont]|nr:MAG: hypothetical protein [Olavius algarvensis Gamma 3 endosymbiont]